MGAGHLISRGRSRLPRRALSWSALLWVCVAWWLSLRAAAGFAALAEATFDVQRWLLYDHIGWPRPADSQREPERGRLLSEFLARGTTQHRVVVYRPPGESDDAQSGCQ